MGFGMGRFGTGAIAVGSAMIAAGASAQVADPVPGSIPLGETAVRVEVVAQLEDSGSTSRPKARPMMLSGDGSGRRFVADQNGLLYQLHPDGGLSVFLDLRSATDLFADQSQRGLSSFAFHPDYHATGEPGFGKLYTASAQTSASGTPDYPVPSGAPSSHHSVIHEWDVSGDPDAIDAGSDREVLRIEQPYKDHNVGQIAFDPNVGPTDPDYGLLYIAMGDGGNVGSPRPTVDPHLVGQDLGHPLGSLLRIDPLEAPGGGAPYSIPSQNPFALDGDAGTLGEIWAYGLRNPHRFAWDRGGLGRMLISDIGQANVEEINLGQTGANYGWSLREGTYLVMHDDALQVFPLPPEDPAPGFSYPVLQYDHDEDDRAVSGGTVYRGPTIPALAGEYVFGDLVSGRLFHAPVDALDGTGQVAFEELRLIDDADDQEKSLLEMIGGGTPAPRADLRFGTDDAGEIYLLTKRDGSIRRLMAATLGVPGLGPEALAALALVLGAGALRRLARANR
jgi:glucose/arabinose dehydrogenase